VVVGCGGDLCVANEAWQGAVPSASAKGNDASPIGPWVISSGDGVLGDEVRTGRGVSVLFMV